jgi:hypothetical protein
MRGLTWARSWKSCARPRSRPGFSRSAAFAFAPSDASTSPSPLRLGEGRDLATRKKAGEHIFKALSSYLDPVFAGSKFALSFDMQINDKETSWKRNNIHDALKAEAAHG